MGEGCSGDFIVLGIFGDDWNMIVDKEVLYLVGFGKVVKIGNFQVDEICVVIGDNVLGSVYVSDIFIQFYWQVDLVVDLLVFFIGLVWLFEDKIEILGGMCYL